MALVRDVLMRIEQPEAHGAPAEPDSYETLGQFYHALEMAMSDLNDRFELFADPQASCQLSDPAFYQPVAFDAEDSGGLMLIDDLESAQAAIEVIVHQGEGLSTERWADPSHQELTHYAKLLQIADGTKPLGAVRPLRSNPRTADLPEPLRPVSDLFNAVYRSLFLLLADLYEPGDDKGPAVGRMYGLMAGAMSSIAHYLVEQPVGSGEFAGPTFEIYEFASDDNGGELIQLAGQVARSHPGLAQIERAIAGVAG